MVQITGERFGLSTRRRVGVFLGTGREMWSQGRNWLAPADKQKRPA